MIGLGEKLARCPPIVVTIDGYHRGRQLRPPAFDLFEQLLAVHPVMLMCSAMTEMGHEERFPATRLSAGYGFRKETLAGTRRNGRDAPLPDTPGGGVLLGRGVEEIISQRCWAEGSS